MQEPLRALVVDDTTLYRKVLSDLLSEIPGVEVVGTAPNGKIALAKIPQLRPDILTLDFEMPEMNGLETLQQLKTQAPQVGAIMISSHTSQGAKITMDALELGAFDFVAKPEAGSMAESIESLRSRLKPIIQAYLIRKVRRIPGASPRVTPMVTPRVSPPLVRSTAIDGRIDLVAIGISTGGPNALAHVIPQLPSNLGVPIVIVQHMPPIFTAALAESLTKKSQIKVVEAQHGQVLEPNVAYIAPGGKQMGIAAQGTNYTVVITDDPPENHCKPSVDYLFRALASTHKNRVLSIIMTGMGADGTRGLKLLKAQGAKVLAQDEASCVVFGMPMEAIKAGVVDTVLPLDNIAPEIIRLIRKR